MIRHVTVPLNAGWFSGDFCAQRRFKQFIGESSDKSLVFDQLIRVLQGNGDVGRSPRFPLLKQAGLSLQLGKTL